MLYSDNVQQLGESEDCELVTLCLNDDGKNLVITEFIEDASRGGCRNS